MKSFQFKLDRIRSYKNQVLDREKRVLAAIQKKRDEILSKILELERFIIKKTDEAAERQRIGISMSEMSSYCFLIENARLQSKMLNEELQKTEAELEAQRQVVVLTYQEKTGMDKLEEKQLEEYRLLESKVTEREIMQVISNKMADKSRKNNVESEIT